MCVQIVYAFAYVYVYLYVYVYAYVFAYAYVCIYVYRSIQYTCRNIHRYLSTSLYICIYICVSDHGFGHFWRTRSCFIIVMYGSRRPHNHTGSTCQFEGPRQGKIPETVACRILTCCFLLISLCFCFGPCDAKAHIVCLFAVFRKPRLLKSYADLNERVVDLVQTCKDCSQGVTERLYVRPQKYVK